MHSKTSRPVALGLAALVLAVALPARAASTNDVANGSFERSSKTSGAPDDWAAAGNQAVVQRLSRDVGRDKTSCARLECSAFNGDGPDFHAMLAQVGHVSVQRGRWYRLEFWARAEAIKAGSVEVALTNTRPWENAGLSDAFTPDADWKHFTLLFRARADVPAATSRLQFWFKSTGTLWLDDVMLTETGEGQQWFPQLATDGMKNFVPNSSFECGAANWGGYTWGLGGWNINLDRLLGDVVTGNSVHGKHCLKIAVDSTTLPTAFFDYYDPLEKKPRRVLAATRGWFRVTPGQKLTLSASLRADVPGLVAQLAAIGAPERLQNKTVSVTERWQRYQFTFAPREPFLFIAIGVDLDASRRERATLWVDAIQLERGEQATSYEPRAPLESFIATAAPGNTFADAARGLPLRLRAFNDSRAAQPLRGELTVCDFFDQPVATLQPTNVLNAHESLDVRLPALAQLRQGFFRATWNAGTSSNDLRCAIMEPVPAADSPFGFNHAFPWDSLLEQARAAGILWWRDWSAKWQTVEPEEGRFDFAPADAQINRVLALNARVDILLPFPSARWSSLAPVEDVKPAAGQDSSSETRLAVAYAPRESKQFGRYAAAVARQYVSARNPAPTFEILNEPLYTHYALPRAHGYKLDDYLALVRSGSAALRQAAPQARIVGGIGASADAALTREFVLAGGMKLVDVLDVHMYDPARPAEGFEDMFAALETLIRQNGGPKPVWITEWGCYADDDPASMPPAVGDATMNRCRWPSERAATEHIVKFTTIALAHNVQKIFFHAGVAAPINGGDASGVVFEYGGAPRKMLPGIAAFVRLIGQPEQFVQAIRAPDLTAYVFRKGNRGCAVAWHPPGLGKGHSASLPDGVRAFDVMGNSMAPDRVTIGESPVYITAPTLADLERALH